MNNSSIVIRFGPGTISWLVICVTWDPNQVWIKKNLSLQLTQRKLSDLLDQSRIRVAWKNLENTSSLFFNVLFFLKAETLSLFFTCSHLKMQVVWFPFFTCFFTSSSPGNGQHFSITSWKTKSMGWQSRISTWFWSKEGQQLKKK
jgi:hypothetical protein